MCTPPFALQRWVELTQCSPQHNDNSGKEIKDKVHEFDGMQYYSVPPKYVHYIVGSMQEGLIDRQSALNMESDLDIELIPLSPILNDRISPSDDTDRERMVALELEFKALDMTGDE